MSSFQLINLVFSCRYAITRQTSSSIILPSRSPQAGEPIRPWPSLYLFRWCYVLCGLFSSCFLKLIKYDFRMSCQITSHGFHWMIIIYVGCAALLGSVTYTQYVKALLQNKSISVRKLSHSYPTADVTLNCTRVHRITGMITATKLL